VKKQKKMGQEKPIGILLVLKVSRHVYFLQWELKRRIEEEEIEEVEEEEKWVIKKNSSNYPSRQK